MKNKTAAFSLFELLILLFVIAILAGFAIPVFYNVKTKGQQTKSLSNVKQIVLALRLYASDNNGSFPSYTLKNGQPTKTNVADSNTAFAQLFPNYIEQEAIFYIQGSAFTPHQPDEVTDNPPLDTPVHTLQAGENAWAFVLNLNDSSNPAVPLVVDGFADPAAHTFIADPTQKGGAWNGRNANVAHIDGSAQVLRIDPASMKVLGPNGNGTGDIFTTANGDNGWLDKTNTIVNPK